MGKKELVALLNLSYWCLVMVERLFLAVPRGCLRFVIVVFPDHTHLLFFRITAGFRCRNPIMEMQKKHFYSKNIFYPKSFLLLKKLAHEDFNFGLSYG